MDDATAAQTQVCYDGFTFYVINPTLSILPHIGLTMKFSALPGGTWDDLQDPRWAGLSLDDFVISSWEGYKRNGMQNGYSPLNDSGDDTGILFGDGVQTPGFASLPVCVDLGQLYITLGTRTKNYYESPFYPCDCPPTMCSL
jgi:hypothetical protein